MLEVSGLHKKYGDPVAVHEVSFRAERRDGGAAGTERAGKTTTVAMIAGLLTPDSGEVRMDGKAVAAIPIR